MRVPCHSREQRDAEARYAAPQQTVPRSPKPTARGRVLGRVLDDREIDRQMTIALATPSLFGHLLPGGAQWRVMRAPGQAEDE